jgi:hypothetical protein
VVTAGGFGPAMPSSAGHVRNAAMLDPPVSSH